MKRFDYKWTFPAPPPAPVSLPASHPHLAQFRRLVKETTAHAGHAGPLTSIAGAGAVYWSDSGLNTKDQFWLQHTLELCRELNVGIAADYTFTPVNLLRNEDFLDPALPVRAQILIACYIPNPDLLNGDPYRDNPRYRHFYTTSPLHSRDAYKEAAKRMGAKLVVSFSRDREICARDFQDPEYTHYTRGTVTFRCGLWEKEKLAMEAMVHKDLALALRL